MPVADGNLTSPGQQAQEQALKDLFVTLAMKDTKLAFMI
jgi:hypothetical protein